MVGGEHFIS